MRYETVRMLRPDVDIDMLYWHVRGRAGKVEVDDTDSIREPDINLLRIHGGRCGRIRHCVWTVGLGWRGLSSFTLFWT